MYISKTFQQHDESELIAMMRKYPFATLIVMTKAGIEATHLPVIISDNADQLVIQGQIAKANKLWQATDQDADVLVVFNGPNCYISPNHYPLKQVSGKAVPTWNYVVIHVKGKITFIHDNEWIYNVISTLTQEHEAQQTTPWSMNDAPSSYIDNMLPAIVGLEITINSIQGQWKLSQNQPDVNKLGVIQGLKASEKQSERSIATLIQKHR